jgi:signal transduction histidine kinase
LLNAIESYEGLPGNDKKERAIKINIQNESDHVALTVKDEGCGMTPEVEVRIFEAFFTTKAGSKGIGIGLATIKKIVEEDLFGTITVESRSGQGTKFIVAFPIEHEKAQRADRAGDIADKKPAIR